MEYDFRKRTGSSYDSNIPSYGRPPSAAASSAAASHPVYGQQPSLYPKIGSTGAHSASAHVRNPPFHHAPPPPSSCTPLPFLLFVYLSFAYSFSTVIDFDYCYVLYLVFDSQLGSGLGLLSSLNIELLHRYMSFLLVKFF